MASGRLLVPPPRPTKVRRKGDLVRLASRLPSPVHFVLAGGGAHGCVQWGSLQALAETDIRPDALIGSSAGALTGAIVAEDPVAAVHRLAYVWSQLDLQALLGDGWLSIVRSATKGAAGLADSAAEAEAIESILVARSFDELDIPFAAVTTDLASGRPVAHDSGPLIPALLASSAIPGVLPPVEIDGRLQIDGLASANLPAQLAIRRGAGSIVVLDTGARSATELAVSAPRIVGRVNSILAAAQRRAQLSVSARHVPVIVLPSPQDLGGALDFRGTVAAAERSYELGRAFLQDLANQLRGTRQLAHGLYARPGRLAEDPDIAAVLKPVAS